jgi:hypothetical protein
MVMNLRHGHCLLPWLARRSILTDRAILTGRWGNLPARSP